MNINSSTRINIQHSFAASHPLFQICANHKSYYWRFTGSSRICFLCRGLYRLPATNAARPREDTPTGEQTDSRKQNHSSKKVLKGKANPIIQFTLAIYC